MEASLQPRRSTCLICEGNRVRDVFAKNGFPVCRCRDCGFMFLNPQPSDQTLAEIYTSDYFLMSDSEEGNRLRSEMKLATGRLYVNQLLANLRRGTGKLLEIGCGGGEFLLAARDAGLEVCGVEVSEHAAALANSRLGIEAVRVGTIDSVNMPDEAFDVCVAFDVIEHVREPDTFLLRVLGMLKPGGTLFLVTPSLQSWSARLMRRHWMEFKTEHLHYFGPKTICRLLTKTGFDSMHVSPNYKCVTFDYVYRHFQRIRVPFYTPLVGAIRAILPTTLRDRIFRVYGSGLNVVCKKRLEVV